MVSCNQDLNAETDERRFSQNNKIAVYGNKRALPSIKEMTPRIDDTIDQVRHNRSITQLINTSGEKMFIFNVYIANRTSNEWIEGLPQIKEAFNTLIEEIEHYQMKGSVLIMMDANARTSTDDDGCDMIRRNVDETQTDLMGEQLLNLCRKTGLAILNGRQGHDGGFTRRGTASESVIDYILVQKRDIQHFQMKIVRLDHLSDHHMLQVYSNDTLAFTTAKKEDDTLGKQQNKVNKLQRLEEHLREHHTTVQLELQKLEQPTEIYDYLHELTIEVPTEGNVVNESEATEEDVTLRLLRDEKNRCRELVDALPYYHEMKQKTRDEHNIAVRAYRKHRKNWKNKRYLDRRPSSTNLRKMGIHKHC
jgi:hypothetical protein